MAKRLTDTTKWSNPAFRKLPSKYKLLYLYILDNCDCAGVMHIDLELVGFFLGEEFSLPEVRDAFKERLCFISDDKIVVRNYVAFQNGDIADSKSSIAKSIRSNLHSHGIWDRYCKGEFGHVNKAVTLWDAAS